MTVDRTSNCLLASVRRKKSNNVPIAIANKLIVRSQHLLQLALDQRHLAVRHPAHQTPVLPEPLNPGCMPVWRKYGI